LEAYKLGGSDKAPLTIEGHGKKIEFAHSEAVFFTFRDITERARFDEAMQERLALEHLVSSVSAELINTPCKDLSGTLQWALGQLGHHFDTDRCYLYQLDRHGSRYHLEHVWQRNETEMLHPAEWELPVERVGWITQKLFALQTVQIGGISRPPVEAKAEIELMERHGAQSALLVPMSYQNRVIGFLGLDSHRDIHWSQREITPLMTIADLIAGALQRAKHEQDLLSAVDAAEAGVKAKAQFIAHLSHEIRTPLNAILGFTELLSSGSLDAEQRDHLEAVQSGGKTLLRLVNDILDMSKIDAGKVQLQYGIMKPRPMFEEIRRIFVPQSAGKPVEFGVEVSPEVPEALVLDEIRLRQILYNLAGNAVKFTDEGHIELVASARPSEQSSDRIDFTIQIRDTGCGIAEEEQARIFEAFEQARVQSAKIAGGTGLGLAISRRLAVMMGGDLHLQSRVDEGSTFTLVLPGVESTTLSDAFGDEPTSEDAVGMQFNGETVLIIDDAPLNRRLLRNHLQNAGLIPQEADTEDVALNLLSEQRPALILLSGTLEGKPTTEFNRRLKQDEQLRAVPVVLVTAAAPAVEKMQASGLPEGVFTEIKGLLRKPFSRAELMQELARHISPSGAKPSETATL
ncbi:GAF domain-containing protein, partial [bacterium]|nr:GAF domain-containing protein [bacterium]